MPCSAGSNRSAATPTSHYRQARLTPGVVIYRLDDRLFFANARYFKARVHEAIRAVPTPASWLVFDAEAVAHADSTGLEALTTLARDLRHEGITLVVARLRTRMQEQFQQVGVTETIGTGNFYPSVHAAVSRFTHTGTDTKGPAT
jgi:sulfate permease, SulP family